MNWLLKLITDAMMDFMLGTIEMFQTFFNNIFDVIWEINEKLHLAKLSNYIVVLAISYVTFLILKSALCIYVFETEGDSDSDPLEFWTRSSVSVTLIYCGSYIISKLVQLASIISKEVTNKISGLDTSSTKKGESFAEKLKKVIEDCYDGSLFKVQAVSSVFTIILLVLLVSLVIFLFQAAKRGAELLAFQLLLPIVATDCITTNREKWNAFFQEVVICIFGYIIQMAAFSIFSYLFVQGANNPTQLLEYILASIGWLLLVISTPKWLGKFLYTSGVSNGIKSGARSAIYVVPQLLGR